MLRLSQSRFTRKRRAVGAIIGGVILAAILLTTVMVYFITILNNEKAKTSYELLAAQVTQDKAAENMSVPRSHDLVNANIEISVSNNGSLPLVVSKVLLYCTSDTGCPAAEPDADTLSVTLPITLNAGEQATIQVGSVSDLLRYRIDVISERGNIVSAKECDVDLTEGVCQNDSSGDDGSEPPCLTCAVTEGIIQGTGTTQLDFKAFGALFPDLKSRSDSSGVSVDQRGWDVVTSSPYGSATGYPAFDMPVGLNAVLVEKGRNLDLSGDDLRLNRNTGLQILGGVQGSQSQQPLVFLCKEDKINRQFIAYNEATAPKDLPWTALDADMTENWQELFFCSAEPAKDNVLSPWTPTAPKWNNLNGILMIERGTFLGSAEEYAQTIPYQGVSLGIPGVSGFVACLRDGASDVSTACREPTKTETAGDIAIARYSYTTADISAGKKLFVHINSPTTGPYNVAWIYPDGTRTVLYSGSLNARSNLGPIGGISPPSTMSDGTPIQKGFYTIVVTDSYGTFDNSAKVFPKNVYYMTFQVR